MRIENEAAYVLEARPYRETSVLVEMLTAEHGRVALVARGVRGEGRRQAVRRAALEPFRLLRIAFSGRGEVMSLSLAETEGVPLYPVGKALFAALYVNELLQKMTGRGDPSPLLFARYSDWLSELGQCLGRDDGRRTAGDSPDRESDAKRGDLRNVEAALAWALRRFERDLLGLLGYALALDHDSDTGEPLRMASDYAFDPEHGARLWSHGSPWPKAKGSTLMAWAKDDQPSAEETIALKHLARQVIRHHLDGVELRTWRLAAEWRTRTS